MRAAFTLSRALCVVAALSLSACGAQNTVDETSPEASASDEGLEEEDLNPVAFVGHQTLEGPYFQDFRIKNIRVKIFPHNRFYFQPQGREAITDRVTFSSQAETGCTLFSAPKTRSAKELLVTVKDAGSTGAWVRCPGRVALKRGKSAQGRALGAFIYEGEFHVYARKTTNGRVYLLVVQHLPFEQYIKGVIPSEMPKKWPLEALKVQAVAARTYAAFQYLKREEDNPDEVRESEYDVDDTVAFQAYLGVTPLIPNLDDSESAPAVARVIEAVESTRDEVLVHDAPADGQPRIIKAFFSANSGGYTESALNLFGADLPYCRSKKEPFDPDLIPVNRWTAALRGSTLESGIHRFFATPAGFDISNVSIAGKQRFESGRVRSVSIGWRNSTGARRTTVVPAIAFQRGARLRSLMFKTAYDSKSHRWVFHGSGHGHGVGMSQWGARILTEQMAWDYRKVLEFYYDGARVVGVGEKNNP